MDYEKKYKEALELAKDYFKANQRLGELEENDMLSDIFPELTESKDERIRKWIIGVLSTYEHDKNLIDDAIAWLEKQGKQKGYTFKSIPRLLDMIEPSDKAKAYCQKLIDALAKEGYNTDAKIVEVVLNGWNGEDVPMAVMDEQKPFDYENANIKQTDFAPNDEEMKELLRTEYEKGRADAIAEMQKPVDCIDCTNSKGCINCKDGNMKETLVRKPAWSEEDENILDAITYTVKNSGYKHCIGVSNEMMITFIKSLKGRVQPKQEWSKENDLILETIIDHIIPDKPFIANGFTDEELVTWLKSLRPQNTWRPSDEQMEALQYVYRNLNPPLSDKLGWNSLKTLELMYQDLKKLKG